MSIIVNGKLRIKGVTTAGPGGGGGGGTDADAQAFITAASITDSTQQSAINTLVVDLKAANIWTKMKAIYPMVGGTASSHKFNLKDPRDLDAAYRLVFNGGWTHSSTGALPNGTTGYADTKFNPSSLPAYSMNMSYYSRTQSQQSNSLDMGATNGNDLFLILPRTNNTSYSSQYGTISTTSVSNTTGLWISNRTTSTASSHKLIRNNSILVTGTSDGFTRPSLPIYLGAANLNNILSFGFSNKEVAFSTLGEGLTDAEASAFYTAVQAFQTTLGRQV